LPISPGFDEGELQRKGKSAASKKILLTGAAVIAMHAFAKEEYVK